MARPRKKKNPKIPVLPGDRVQLYCRRKKKLVEGVIQEIRRLAYEMVADVLVEGRVVAMSVGALEPNEFEPYTGEVEA